VRTPAELAAAREASGAIASQRSGPRAPYVNHIHPESGRPRPSQYAERRCRLMIRATISAVLHTMSHCRSIDFRPVGLRNSVERAFHWLLQLADALMRPPLFLFRCRLRLRAQPKRGRAGDSSVPAFLRAGEHGRRPAKTGPLGSGPDVCGVRSVAQGARTLSLGRTGGRVVAASVSAQHGRAA